MHKSITRPIPHCIIKVPKKISKLNDVSDLPAKLVGKRIATAGWVRVSTIEVNIYTIKCVAPALSPETMIINKDK